MCGHIYMLGIGKTYLCKLLCHVFLLPHPHLRLQVCRNCRHLLLIGTSSLVVIEWAKKMCTIKRLTIADDGESSPRASRAPWSPPPWSPPPRQASLSPQEHHHCFDFEGFHPFQVDLTLYEFIFKPNTVNNPHSPYHWSKNCRLQILWTKSVWGSFLQGVFYRFF